MTGVVYKFDLANKAFVAGAWFVSQTLFPHSFKTDKTLTIGGETLAVWYDPSIRAFIRGICWLFALHVLAFLYVGYLIIDHH